MVRDVHNKSTDTIGLRLTQGERKLLLDLFVLGNELEEQIRQRPTSAPIMLTLDELDVLAEGIAAEANHTESRKKQKRLRELYNEVENLLSQHQAEEPSSTDEEPKIIDLSNFSSSPLRIENEAMDYLCDLVDSIEEVCSERGIDVDKLLETLKPTQIEPHQTIGVRLSKAQRELVLGLRELSEGILMQVRDTPPRKQKVDFTLSQINEIENSVAKTIQETSDRKRKRKLQLLDGELVNMQVKYTAEDDSKYLGPQVFTTPNNVSRGAIVRKLLVEMLGAGSHKNKRK